MKTTLYCDDALERLRQLPSNSFDSIVTDPPYGLAFMGKKWDYDVPAVEIWEECLRVLKPGGHLLAFAGSRTYHRMACRIEDAGFEIRDQVMWLYGSGFPKSMAIDKAIDRALGAEREVTGTRKVSPSDLGQASGWNALDTSSGVYHYTAAATEEAKKWEGWGSALKPAHEPIVMARKPFHGTLIANVMEHGTGAINIDACRGEEGRWPTNLAHDNSESVLEVFPNRKGGEGSAARYFYCAKPSKAERNEGLSERKTAGECTGRKDGSDGLNSPRAGAGRTSGNANFHPTVKPISLMKWLIDLVTPAGGETFDPFMGSGTTAIAAEQSGVKFTGIEREREYFDLATRRISHWKGKRQCNAIQQSEPTQIETSIFHHPV